MSLLKKLLTTAQMRIYLLIAFSTIILSLSYACTWTTTGLSSTWTNASAWTKSGSGCGGATYPSTGSINSGDIVIINHSISLTTGTYTIKNGGTLNVNAPATFTVNGAVDVQNGSTFSVANGANMNVSGNFNNSNNSVNVTVNGSVNVGGNLTLGTGSSITSSSSSGGFTVQGGISGSGSLFGSPVSCADGALPCVSSAIAPLPVEFVSASVECLDTDIKVEWQTNSEYNAAFYALETSRDMAQWETEVLVEANGNTNDKSVYQVLMVTESPYVRLIQTDNDGKRELLSTLSVNCSNKRSGIIVYPNPATDVFHVDISNLVLSTNTQLIVTDLFGKTIFSEELEASKSTYSFHLESEHIPPGTYTVSVKGSGTISPQRLITR